MFATDVTVFMSPYKHQNVELLTKRPLGAEQHCQLLHGPAQTTRETRAVEEANEWRPLHHPQPAWCPQQGPASSEYNLSMSFILQFNERTFSHN